MDCLLFLKPTTQKYYDFRLGEQQQKPHNQAFSRICTMAVQILFPLCQIRFKTLINISVLIQSLFNIIYSFNNTTYKSSDMGPVKNKKFDRFKNILLV